MAEIDVTSLEPNSHKYKAEKAKGDVEKKKRERLSPVVTSDKIASTKKPLGQRFMETFIAEDVTDIKTWLWRDMIVPGAQKALLDVLNFMFYGEVSRDERRSTRDRRDSRTDYRGYYSGRSSEKRRSSSRRDRYEADDRVDFRNIVLRNRGDAEDLIDRLRDRIEDTGSVSVADLLDMVDATSRYTDNNWGWTDPRDIGIRRVSNGFLINVAEPEYID